MARLNPIAILASAVLMLAPTVSAEGFCFWCLFECPKDDSIGEACLRSVIPPWPICKFKTVPEYIEHAKDSATRCCGDDLSECRCPKKDTDKFLEEIGPWCQGVASCPNDDDEAGDILDALEVTSEEEVE